MNNHHYRLHKWSEALNGAASMRRKALGRRTLPFTLPPVEYFAQNGTDAPNYGATWHTERRFGIPVYFNPKYHA